MLYWRGHFIARRTLILATCAVVALIAGVVTATHLGAATTPPGPAATAPAATGTTDGDGATTDLVAMRRTRLRAAIDIATTTLADAQGVAAPEQLTALQAAIDTAAAALDGADLDAMAAALDALEAAQASPKQALADAWARAAEEAALARQHAAEETRRAREDARRAAAQEAAEQPHRPQQRAPAPEESGRRTTPVTTAPPDKTALELFTDALTGIGVTDVTVSLDWHLCGHADKGPDWVQGCVHPDRPGQVVMKDVTPAVAATEIARSVVLHEYAHALQSRLGLSEVVRATDPIFGPGKGLEESADCMAIALGATGRPGGYTNDCSGARGEAAAALLAGRLP